MNASAAPFDTESTWLTNGHSCFDSGSPPLKRNIRGNTRQPRWNSQALQHVNQKKPQRTCGVCGDKARSLHFGGLSCDSCKAFFRRAVQSTAYKNFHCPQQATQPPEDRGHLQLCIINITSRKSCQKCRFERCVQIGMEVSWVMSEAERQRLLSARLAKKQKTDNAQVISSSSLPPHPLQDYMWPLKPEPVELETFLSSGEVSSIAELKRAWGSAIQQVPPTRLEGMNLSVQVEDQAQIIRSTAGSVHRFQIFAQPLLQALAVIDADRRALLQNSMLEMCIFRSALNHGRSEKLLERYFPQQLLDIHSRFVKGMHELSLDQTSLLLFFMVILMNPERSDLVDSSTIDRIQEYYLVLLNKYLSGRYGNGRASVLYPKLLSKLADLRELSDCHQREELMLATTEVKAVLSRMLRAELTYHSPQLYLGLNIPTQHNYCSDGFQPAFSSSPSSSNSPTSPQCYTPNVSSPCDPVSKIFPSPQFTDSSSEDLYVPIPNFESKEQDQFFPSFVYNQGAGEVIELVNNPIERPRYQEFQFSQIQEKINSYNGRYQLYDPAISLGNELYTQEDAEKEELMDASFDQDCQGFAQNCFQGEGTPLAAPTTPTHNMQDNFFDFSSSINFDTDVSTSYAIAAAAFNK